VLKSVRLKWSKYEEYIDEKRNAYFGWKTSKKRPIGRTRAKWKKNIKVYG
jgi:hypothetical protein